ncbi:uncharacterized protein [Amphiura filiformis]|uniref:uncharacterized protein n=1 Tax=Amphiura filiformis TaxID=82378 RepID=UPI003B21F67C
MSIPICNENATFSLPGDGSVKSFALALGETFSQTAVEAVMNHLGIIQYISGQTCSVTQVDLQKTDCPSGLVLPSLDNILTCGIEDIRCLGIQCCVNIDFAITKLMMKVGLSLDPCNFQVSVGFETFSRTVTLFTHKWGSVVEQRVSDALVIRYSVYKLETANMFSITLDIILCIDDTCNTIPVFREVKFPIPICNIDFNNFVLPGDGSVAGFVEHLGGKIGDSAVEVVLKKFGLEEYFGGLSCSASLLSPSGACPSIVIPKTTDASVCQASSSCLGVTCCIELDLIVTRIRTHAWILDKPCNLVMAIGLGTWKYNISLVSYSWGENETLSIGDAVKIRYSADKLDDTNEYVLQLTVSICLDGTCTDIPIANNIQVPISPCGNVSVTLPGDGTIDGYLQEIAKYAGENGVAMVMQHFDLEDFILEDQCETSTYIQDGSCTDISLPTINGSEACVLDPWCLGVECCLNMDFRIAHITSKAWFLLDPCEYDLSIGIGTWFRNISLFSYTWGTDELNPIGTAITASYNIDKLDAKRVYQVDLSFQTNLEGVIMDYPILKETQIPIPFCTKNFTRLPGDGTVHGFLEILGGNVGRTAINLVLAYLGLEDIVGETQCSVKKISQVCFIQAVSK